MMGTYTNIITDGAMFPMIPKDGNGSMAQMTDCLSEQAGELSGTMILVILWNWKELLQTIFPAFFLPGR